MKNSRAQLLSKSILQISHTKYPEYPKSQNNKPSSVQNSPKHSKTLETPEKILQKSREQSTTNDRSSANQTRELRKRRIPKTVPGRRPSAATNGLRILAGRKWLNVAYPGRPSARRWVMRSVDRCPDVAAHGQRRCDDPRTGSHPGWLTSSSMPIGTDRPEPRRTPRRPAAASGSTSRDRSRTWRVRSDICTRPGPLPPAASPRLSLGSRICRRTSSRVLLSWCSCRSSTWNQRG